MQAGTQGNPSFYLTQLTAGYSRLEWAVSLHSLLPPHSSPCFLLSLDNLPATCAISYFVE